MFSAGEPGFDQKRFCQSGRHAAREHFELRKFDGLAEHLCLSG